MSRQFAIIPFRALEDTRLLPSDKLVLAALGCHTDKWGYCWPSVGRLAALAGVRERSITRCLRRLESCGYVTSQRRHRDTTLYKVRFDWSGSDFEGDNLSGDPTGPILALPGHPERVQTRSGTEKEGKSEHPRPSLEAGPGPKFAAVVEILPEVLRRIPPRKAE